MGAKYLSSSRNTAHDLSPVSSRYLEAIYYMTHEGESVRPSRLAEWLGVSAPTVTGVVQRLRDEGYLHVRTDRSIALTETGEAEAGAIVRRHRIVERWLADDIGLDWAAADLEAGRIAHFFSDDLVLRIFARLGRPSTCPHGNEIPGVESGKRRLVSLAELSPNVVAPIARISEVAEHQAPQLLRLLDREGLHLGELVSVQRSPGADAVTVIRGSRQTALGMGAAQSVWVDLSQAPRAAHTDRAAV